MEIFRLVEFTFIFLLGNFIVSAFMKSRRPGDTFNNPPGPFATVMRYIGYTIIFSFAGLMLAAYIIEVHLAQALPRAIIVLFFTGLGLLIGIYVAWRFPRSLK
jgi:hypothetical protein